MAERGRLGGYERDDRLKLVLLRENEDPVLPTLRVLCAHLRAQSSRLGEVALADEVLDVPLPDRHRVELVCPVCVCALARVGLVPHVLNHLQRLLVPLPLDQPTDVIAPVARANDDDIAQLDEHSAGTIANDTSIKAIAKSCIRLLADERSVVTVDG